MLADNKVMRKESLFVINWDDEIDGSKSFSNFLTSAKLKDKYDAMSQRILSEKNILMTKLKTISQSTKCEVELQEVFSERKEDIYSLY